jgi:hypothetical protein
MRVLREIGYTNQELPIAAECIQSLLRAAFEGQA